MRTLKILLQIQRINVPNCKNFSKTNSFERKMTDLLIELDMQLVYRNCKKSTKLLLIS